MKTRDQSYALIDIDSVAPHPRNPRKGDVELIGESIQANGFYGAIVVQRSSGHIVVGNHRWKAAKANGATQIPALLMDCDDDRALRIMLADNKASDDADNEPGGLRELLAELSSTDTGLSGTLYSDDDAVVRSLAAADGSTRLGEMQYQLIVDCRDQDEQAALLERLIGEGYECRALML